jgi:hypothetical protein
VGWCHGFDAVSITCKRKEVQENAFVLWIPLIFRRQALQIKL